MVVCRFYRQGNCQYGPYCQFEHVNSFGNKAENCNDDEFAAAAVANEVLMAERGGQWLLSCFGPFKEKPCIPGMEDLSPEEVRWEMYQAEKNGMGQQAKLHFQQLCQDMKAKRDALKSPNSETIAMLKKLMGTTTETSSAATKSTFSFATPQLGLPSSTASSSAFGNKTFGTQSNAFSGGFTSSSSNAIFGRTNQTTTNPIFGGTPTFGNALGQNTQAFGSIAPQSNPVFGTGTSQSVFGQPSVFAASGQTSNVFARPQTSQTTTPAFDSNATSSSSIFGGPIPAQPNTSLFGVAKTSAPNPFGSSTTLQTTNSVFGATTSAPSFSSGLFSQSKPAFGGAPVFGGVSGFSGNSTGTMFGGQGTFGGAPGTSNNIFGAPKTTTPAFGTSSSANTFGANTATTASNVFGTTPSAGPAPNASPFGPATTSAPFATSATQFDAATTGNNLFAKPAFGLAPKSGEPFSNPPVTSASSSSTGTPFGNATTGLAFGATSTTGSPFGGGSTFGEAKSSPFAATSTTSTATTANPFAPRNQQQTTSPFGSASQTGGSTVTSSPFGRAPFGSTVMTTTIDDSVYTEDGQLTDDEKCMYMAEKFVLGKIPLKPPTKDIR